MSRQGRPKGECRSAQREGAPPSGRAEGGGYDGAASRRLDLARLVAAVQTNCHIADARHAADMSLCTYLLQMREFYRWEQALPLGETLPREQVGAWLDDREALWQSLEARAFVPLPVGPVGLAAESPPPFDPFDVEALNARLLPLGLVYGAGLAGPRRPGFFLARLHALDQRDDGITLQVCGPELARGLFAPPAALCGDTVVLRRECLARWLWEKFEGFEVRRPDVPFRSVVRAYALDRDFGAALPRMLDELSRTLVLHELGEHRVGRRLEPDWAAMRMSLHSVRTDWQVRAVRDHLADLEVTLPELLDDGAATPIHFWFSGFDGLREQLFPSLRVAYRAWCDGDGGNALAGAVRCGAEHFRQLAEQVLALHRREGDRAEASVAALLGAPSAVCHGA